MRIKPFLVLLYPLYIATSVFYSSSAIAIAATNDNNDILAANNMSSDRWYERSFDQLLKTKIITSTRDEQPIQSSPTTVSVYTAAEIKGMGIRTIKELLDRTTGFFVNQQLAGPAIGSRGFISDNEQFLLLIDGHSLNSTVEKGAGNFFLFPFLEQVERIEILRGPGSTLWGSDAALGIVHIITKDGKGINGIKTMASTSTVDHLNYLNVQAGKQVNDKVNYMLSVTNAKSDGYVDNYLKSPSRVLPANGRWDKLGESTELYFKAQLDDLTIHARSADMINQRPGGSMVAGEVLGKLFDIVNPPTDPDALYNLYLNLQKYEYFTRRQHNYIDVEHKKALKTNINLETRLFVDNIDSSLASTNPVLSPGTSIVEESAASKENTIGLESLLHWQIYDHKLLFGIKAVQTEIGPVSNTVTYPTTSTPSTLASDYIRSMRVVPNSKDRNLALFMEDGWTPVKQFTFTYGLRIDKNTLREDSTILLPKLDLRWSMTPEWISNYSFTTGYIRPPAGIGFLGQSQQYNSSLSPTDQMTIFGAQDSEEVMSHNLSLTYSKNPLEIKMGLYETDVDHSFNFLYEQATVASEKRVLFYINTDNIKTNGSEIEFKLVTSDSWNLYGNFSYVFDAKLKSLKGSAFGVPYDLNKSGSFGEGAFTADKDVVGYPHQIWNLGINYFISDHISSNLHYHGWTDMTARKRIIDPFQISPTETEKYGPEHFVDLNLRYEKVANTQLDLGFFIKNLLNNDDSKINMLYYTREWSERERSLGLDIAYTF